MENTAYKSFTHSSDEERALLRRLIAGEMAAYETLFHRYYPTFCAFVRGMTKDTFVSEDITQNIFLKVWINRERLDEEKSIRNYLFVLAKHEVYNYLRTKNRTFTPLREVVSGSDARGGKSLRRITRPRRRSICTKRPNWWRASCAACPTSGN